MQPGNIFLNTGIVIRSSRYNYFSTLTDVTLSDVKLHTISDVCDVTISVRYLSINLTSTDIPSIKKEIERKYSGNIFASFRYRHQKYLVKVLIVKFCI